MQWIFQCIDMFSLSIQIVNKHRQQKNVNELFQYNALDYIASLVGIVYMCKTGAILINIYCMR